MSVSLSCRAMRGPHVTERGNAKKYYCSPYGSRALSGRERRWKGGESFLEKGVPSLPQAPSLPFQRLSTLSNPCSQFFPARMTLEWCAFQRECLQAAFGGTMKRGKATIRSAFFPAHAGTDSFRAASPFYESLGRWRGDASLAGGFGGGRKPFLKGSSSSSSSSSSPFCAAHNKKKKAK